MTSLDPTITTNAGVETLRADLHAIAELLEPGARVLDLGCGDGALLDYLVRTQQVKGRGIELSEQGVLACVRRGLSVRQGNLETSLPDYPDHAFDYVVLSQTIPFVDDPAHTCRNRACGRAQPGQFCQLGPLAQSPQPAADRAHARGAH